MTNHLHLSGLSKVTEVPEIEGMSASHCCNFLLKFAFGVNFGPRRWQRPEPSPDSAGMEASESRAHPQLAQAPASGRAHLHPTWSLPKGRTASSCLPGEASRSLGSVDAWFHSSLIGPSEHAPVTPSTSGHRHLCWRTGTASSALCLAPLCPPPSPTSPAPFHAAALVSELKSS